MMAKMKMMDGRKMTAIGYHSCTSMAVKAVVTELKKRLGTKFNFIQGFPDFYYEFDKGLSDQFKQYYAKIPERDRQNDWLLFAYSYDSASASSVQPRRGFSFKRPVTNILKRDISVCYSELPVVFSLLTNNSKLLNGLANYINTNFNWSISCKYQDLLWPEWLPGQTYPLGWYLRPTLPNGKLYMCTTAGASGESEPVWTDTLGEEQQDGDAVWRCIDADLLTVKAGSFVKNDTTISNPIDDGIMYQFDFGYTLHYTDYEDMGGLTGIITSADLTLLNWYKEGAFAETISVPD